MVILYGRILLLLYIIVGGKKIKIINFIFIVIWWLMFIKVKIF